MFLGGWTQLCHGGTKLGNLFDLDNSNKLLVSMACARRLLIVSKDRFSFHCLGHLTLVKSILSEHLTHGSVHQIYSEYAFLTQSIDTG